MLAQIIVIKNKDNYNDYALKYNLGSSLWIPNAVFLILKEINNKEINIIKNISEKWLSIHFDSLCSSAIVIFGNTDSSLISKLHEPFASIIKYAFEHFNLSTSLKYVINGKTFDFSFAYVMGILNVTPDSFSDGGNFIEKDKAVEQALKMIDEGADIVDIGGESTRPGSDFVPLEAEIKRVLPVISEIKKLRPDSVISIDTNKSELARIALLEGADIINDISGGLFDNNIFSVAKNSNAVYILMHIKGTPKNMQENIFYSDLISNVYSDLNKQIQLALETGLTKIIIDPGIGFGKTADQNLELINRLSDFKSLGFPILIGLSRKGFLGKVFNFELKDRDFPSSIAETISLVNGARIIRTHNVKNCRIVCDVFNKTI